MLSEDDLSNIREVFGSRGDVALAHLYGSVATGAEREGSDVDIGVLFDEGKFPERGSSRPWRGIWSPLSGERWT